MNPETISEFIKKAGKPVSFREISDAFTLRASERKKLKRILNELIAQGKIIRNRKGLYLSVHEAKLVTGYFEAHRNGFGFVIPDSPKDTDIFIPPNATMGAMHGDRVVARLEHRRKREGRIIRILERTVKRIVGTVEKSGPIFYIQPRKRNIPQQIILAPQDDMNVKPGDLVLAEITTYQALNKPLVARLLKVFEKPKTPKEDTEILVYEYELPKRFPQNVSTLSKEVADRGISKRQFKDRVDLRELPTVTIDGENAKDFDDAVSIKKTRNGFILWVHIADVSHYVQWNSPIDIEARQRATSVYLPDRVIPMLPPELSENLCSLIPKTPRLTFTVELHLNNSGHIKKSLFYPSVIQTVERMTYTSVKKILIDKDKEEIKRYRALVSHFERMAELCEILKDKRRKRGSLDFDLPEPEVLLDIKGDPQAIIKAERNLAHFIIEEFMILANEAVAEFLYSKNIPALYRVHEEPEANKIQYLAKIIRNLGVLKGDLKPSGFYEFIELIKGTPQEEIVNYLILRSLKQARYSPENVGHFGLASRCYTHFTSPIRRYPDLVVHRILKEYLLKGKLSKEKTEELKEILPDIAIHSSRMERRADDVERDAIQIMRVWFMKDKIGEEFLGKVTMVTPEGLRVRLEEYYIEGFLPVSHMSDDFYQYDENRYCLTGVKRKKKFTIGTSLNVRVSRVSLSEREIVFDI
ncbi:ribonuclease R [Thermodesulfovibrio thiophilus]|uniref:ribonuclease R n=1 Tax=Thermodesulfovibrio thiophilus TaxID=340095 RepID=UPI0017FD481B|nr:ribonuclease R [Thermodesulfovibrio thiophilus]HHW19519.1 ribonuclease R [Thermodesulfovibrio thiophilus]